ncbi:hypothetical protein U8527_18825 [Kordia algicida OT-1]|uniref:Outer membrane protein beta-barrel domain-containing protein n=1 Tax=Kordia algicida OT-1 TaxID=391587 RepID=A9DJ94_9FLAO|nr:hypothetical protein [Kordia algicida]EDP98055.1 hypothetical protein KAOT1_12597 [Kordia algicida OT-1]
MKTSTLYLCLLFLCINFSANAQQKDNIPKRTQDSVALKKERTKKYLANRLRIITEDEKILLKNTVAQINSELEKGKITTAEAEQQKKKAAMLTAANIEYRMAKEKRELLLDYRIQERGSFIRFGEVFDTRKIKKRPFRYDRRTYSDLVFAFGLNNAIQEGKSLSESDYRMAGSRFFEFGISWRTRLFKEHNFVRFKYGISLQYNNLKPTGNRVFVDNGNLTTLEQFPNDLRRSKIRTTNLVVPIYFEFGPSNKKETDRYIRYNTHQKFKIGIGGYAGFNIAVKQKLKYSQDGDRVDQEIRRNFNTNSFVYGLAGYIGWDDLSLYCKYDLSPIFKSPNAKQRNISFGVRLDVF